MNRQNTDLPVMEAQSGLPTVPSAETIDLPPNDVTDESDLDELLDYQPVPHRPARTVLVRLRRRGRLGPLPYALDEDDS
jgi:hypothetical protein